MASNPDPDARVRSAARAFAVAGLAGVGIDLAVLVAAPIVRPEISIIRGALSDYAVGPWAWLQNLGFVALGIGSLAIACALALAGPVSRWLLPGAAALAIAGVAGIGLAVFPLGQPSATTPLGDLHQTAGTIAVAGHLSAMLCILLAAGSDDRWRSVRAAGYALWVAALAGALATQAELSFPDLPVPFGVVMRMVAAPVLVWWALVALRLARGAIEPAGERVRHRSGTRFGAQRPARAIPRHRLVFGAKWRGPGAHRERPGDRTHSGSGDRRA